MGVSRQVGALGYSMMSLPVLSKMKKATRCVFTGQRQLRHALNMCLTVRATSRLSRRRALLRRRRRKNKHTKRRSRSGKVLGKLYNAQDSSIEDESSVENNDAEPSFFDCEGCIYSRVKKLQKVVPGGLLCKDEEEILRQTADYIKHLQMQVMALHSLSWLAARDGAFAQEPCTNFSAPANFISWF